MSDSSAPPTNTETSTGPTSGSGTTAPPTTDTTQPPSSTEPPPSTNASDTTSPSSPPPSSDSPSQTSQPPSQTSGNENPSNTSNPSNTDTNTNTSATPTSSSESTVSTPVATVVLTTVISTNGEGAIITTTLETSTTVPAGGVITTPADANSGASSSSSNTGAIVGGVVGGVAGVAIFALLLVWGYKRWRRRRDLEAFDGNFDPDRIVASRHRNQESIAPTLPDMAQYDDGMGGRLAGTTVGGGVVSPYPLFNQSPSQHGHGSDTTHSYNTHSPPPSATFAGATGDWRHPSPGPSLGTSSSGGMSPSRAAKEREALAGGFVGAGGAGMPIPQHGPPPSSYYAHQPQSPQSRRMSLESSGAHSGVFYSTNSEYSQPNSSHAGSGRLNVQNPDVYGQGFDESARQAYLASGPRGASGGGQEEEIPPTYDSLVGSTSGSGSGRGERKEKGGGGSGLRVTNDTGAGEGSGSAD
ncbi:hypothetical protein AAF712_016422 [Marasmius tenuissimus]|uniref:Uncharacterized protein n=1 Tax=Marasmius tenuissimus TaxID=585030 RepID=A0ABR2Z6S4_9AGAR